MIDIKQCIEDAENHKSKLTDEYISKLEGLSSPKVWHLLNNLCAGSDSYLEIGCFKGSTLLATLYKNPVYAVAIDNFIMSPSTRSEFFENIKGVDVNFFEGDCFSFSLSNVKKPIQLYFFDGGHTSDDQYKALTHFAGCLADEFVFVVDDWDLRKMKVCTVTAVRDLGYKILEMHELVGHTAGSLEDRKAGWWGGLGVLRIKK